MSDNPILLVNRMVEQAESYLSEQAEVREKALKYYAGDSGAIPHDQGRSFSVSKDLRAVVKKLLPSIMRTMFGSNKAAQYQPGTPDDEQAAKQASDYVNNVVMRETKSKKAIKSAIWDALVLKTGALEWSAKETTKVVVTEHTNLSQDAALGLIDDPSNEVFDYEETPETDQAILDLDPNAMRYSFKIRRKEKQTICELVAVPRGSFLISPGAKSIETAPLVGKKLAASRSDLVAQGYDKDKVWSLQQGDNSDDDKSERWGDDWTDTDKGAAKAAQDVEYYEVYARLDYDNDGLAELYKVVYGQSGGAETGADQFVVLEIGPCDEAPFTEITAEDSAHQFEGHSIFEDVEDIQRIKTVLLRATLDNLNWQNNHQRAVQLEAVVNPEAVTNPQMGQDIHLKKGYSAREAIQSVPVPFFAADSFSMMQTMDEVMEDRTGITDASGGINPEGFQNMSATAAHIASESGVAQADMVVRNLAEGIGVAFSGLLRLIVAHQDRPRTVRMSGKWVEYQPDSWNADMDCVVNTGLGGGTRERDMSMLQIVLGLQREIIGSLGAQNPYVKPDQLYNTLEKMTEAAGFSSAEPFFTAPDPQEVQALLAQQGQSDGKAEAQTQKAQMDAQIAQQKVAADIQLSREKLEGEMQIAREKMEAEIQLAREKMRAEIAFGADVSGGMGSPVRLGGAIG